MLSHLAGLAHLRVSIWKIFISPRRDPGKIKGDPTQAGWLTSLMNTYFYKSFLRKVGSHLGEPARLTGPAHLYMNSLLIQTILELYSCKVEIFVKCLFINIQKQQNTLKSSLTNLTGKAREFVGLRMLNFQGRIFIKTRTLDYQIGISVPLILWFCYPI